MAKQLTIKQIAELAGVSAGTVDRILHNRGKISEEALSKVNKVIESQGYKFNIHTSAVSLRKEYLIVVAIPKNEEGEYWDLILQGVKKAEQEYSDLSIDCRCLFFDQYDASSCRKLFDTIPGLNPSGVILGTIYVEETKNLCSTLDKKMIPYVFVDGNVEDTNPVAAFYADQVVCGKLLAKLIRAFSPELSEIALFHPLREGGRISNNSRRRMAAFKKYFKDASDDVRLRDFNFSPNVSREDTYEEIGRFLSENPRVKGIAVGISTASVIAEALYSLGRTDIHICGFDLTSSAKKCFELGILDFVVDQKPSLQGYKAFDAMIHYLVYGTKDTPAQHIIRTEVIFQENF